MKDEWRDLGPGLKYLFVKPAAIARNEPACRIKFNGQVYGAREVDWNGAATLRECRAAEAGARIAVVTTEPVRYKP